MADPYPAQDSTISGAEDPKRMPRLPGCMKCDRRTTVSSRTVVQIRNEETRAPTNGKQSCMGEPSLNCIHHSNELLQRLEIESSWHRYRTSLTC